MKITVIWIGKTSESYYKDAIDVYEKRIGRYIPFSTVTIPDIKTGAGMLPEQLKQKEGIQILSKVLPSDEFVLFDENGANHTSVSFAEWLEFRMITGVKNIVFCIGGAYGFSQDVYNRANSRISLSSMTFSHQMVRIIALEQIYRGMTIIKGEPYHHA